MGKLFFGQTPSTRIWTGPIAGQPVMHVVPKTLRTESLGGSLGQIAHQPGLGEPIPPAPFAGRTDGAIEGRQGQVLPRRESLVTFRAVPIDQFHELRARGFLPKGLGQAPLKDLGTGRRRSAPLDGGDDVLEFTEILLPDAAAAVADAGPLGVIVIGM